MSFTYSGNPASSSLDEVRFLLSDTESENPLLSNEEVEYLLAQQENSYLAAANGAEIISSIFTRRADKEKVGDITLEYKDKARQYVNLAGRLRDSNPSQSITPYCGGISISDKDSRESNLNRLVPVFTRDTHGS